MAPVTLLILGLLVVPAIAADPRDCPYWTVDPAAPEPDPFYLPMPDPDPFYARPDPIPCVPPGTILDSREIVFAPVRGLPLPQHQAWHLKFLSTDTWGNPIAAVAAVVRPMEGTAADPPVLLSYQIAENSLGSVCAPSHVTAGGTANPESEGQIVPILPDLLAEGWTLVFPDHEGPLSAYLPPVGAAHITLDAIRAAVSFSPLRLAVEHTPVGMWGFSGGAVASAWAASLQEGYAPELNIVGVAAGGTVVDFETALREMDGHPFWFRYAFSAALGLTRVYPGVFPASNLDSSGVSTAEAVRDGCAGNTNDGSLFPIGRFADFTLTDALATPEAEAVFAQTSLPQPGLTPITRVYVYHSAGDEVQPVEVVDDLVEAWCADGASVLYNRMPAESHLSSAFTGSVAAVRFLRSRFDDTRFIPLSPTTTSCN